MFRQWALLYAGQKGGCREISKSLNLAHKLVFIAFCIFIDRLFLGLDHSAHDTAGSILGGDLMGVRGISLGSLLMILVIVMLVFGTKRLSTIGEDLGKAIKSFKKGMEAEDEKEEEK